MTDGYRFVKKSPVQIKKINHRVKKRHLKPEINTSKTKNHEKPLSKTEVSKKKPPKNASKERNRTCLND